MPLAPQKKNYLRSLFKGISWRMVGTLDTIVISYLVTGSVRFAGTIGSIQIFTQVALYWLHERIWGRIAWGKQKSPRRPCKK